MCEAEIVFNSIVLTLNTNFVLANSIYPTYRVFNLSKKGGKDQESIHSSTTPDPGYRMGK